MMRMLIYFIWATDGIYMINVLQIILSDNVPDKIKSCIDSVRSFSEKMGYVYKDLRCPNYDLTTSKDFRCISNFMRIDYLCNHPYTLYIDWDVKIIGNYEFKDDIVLSKYYDHLIYNGNNCNVIKKVYEIMLEYEKLNPDNPELIYLAFKAIRGKKYVMKYHQNFYYHLGYTMNGNK